MIMAVVAVAEAVAADINRFCLATKDFVSKFSNKKRIAKIFGLPQSILESC